jgi:uncharacterized protein (DUF58 family)
MKIHLRLTTFLLPALVLVSLILQVINPSRVWTILLIGLGGLWLISYLWARSLAKNLRIERSVRFGWAQVGDELHEQFLLSNNGFFPATWLEIVDRSTLPDHSPRRATHVEGHNSYEWQTNSICTHRGLFTLGGTTLITSDPFGIYLVTIYDPASTSLLVTPPIISLSTLEVTPGGFMGEGRPQANAPDQTVSSASVREYLIGDSSRMIHWPTTARQDKPYVRLLDGTPVSDWWVMLDLDQQVQVGQDWNSTEELGVILAASFADRCLRARQTVGLIVNGQPLIWLPPQRSRNRHWEILRSLAVVRPGKYSLAELLERASPALRRGASLVIITPSVNGNWIQALMPLLHMGIGPTILLIDPATFGGQANTAPTLTVLGEMGITAHVIGRDLLDHPEVRSTYRSPWKRRTSPTSHAPPVRMRGDTAWKRLAG